MRGSKRASVAFLGVLYGCGGAGTAAKGGHDVAPEDKGLNEYIAKQGGISTLSEATEGPKAQRAPLRFERVTPESPIKLDGVLTEWSSKSRLEEVVTEGAKGHASMEVGLAYDNSKIYIGGEVSDEAFYRTRSFKADEDHASLLLAVPTVGGGYASYEIGLFAGKPGEFAGAVKFLSGPRRGTTIEGAKIVEAPMGGGYSFEAQIPWGALPEARLVRVGLHGAVRYFDADASGGTRSVVATAKGDLSSPLSLPWLPTESERALIEQVLSPQELVNTTPLVDIIANIGGGEMKERVAVWGKYLTICGPQFLGGTAFFYRVIDGSFERLEARDVTGRGRDDLILRRKSVAEETAHRETIEIISAIGNAEPVTVFSHELSIGNAKQRVTNALRISGKQIEIAVEPAVGYDPTSFKEQLGPDGEALLLPWGGIKSQTFRFDGSKFVKAHEVTQPSSMPAPVREAKAEMRPVEPPTPDAEPGRDYSSDVLARYRKDRGISQDVKPRFDQKVQLGGDDQKERVLLVGRDLVVFGPGFKGGTGYTTLSLTSFDAADIHEVTVRDLTGDGSAEVIVRGTRRQAASDGRSVSSDLLLVYKLEGEALSRVFAIETAREQGKKRVQGLVQFIPSSSGQGFDIDVQPGQAHGWNAKTFPWTQDEPANGGIEPLLLPWGKIPHVRYSWSGNKFVR